MYEHSFIILLSNFVLANDDNVNGEFKEGFYIITVNKTVEVNDYNGKVKRQEIDIDEINFVIEEIDNLIKQNVDTYENPEKLIELENEDKNEDGKLLKREELSEEYKDYSKSSIVRPIGSNKKEIVFSAYLNSELASLVKNISNVNACFPSLPVKQSSIETNIQTETGWKKVSYKNGRFSLSPVSQGKYNSNLVGKYDTNYYYPTSAGKGINVIIVDFSFILTHSQFSSNSDRVVKCLGTIVNSKKVDSCDAAAPTNVHGTRMTALVGGSLNGAAPKANLYVIGFEPITSALFAALDTIASNDTLFNSGKTIILLPLDIETAYNGGNYNLYENALEELTAKGAVIVTPAGNENVEIYEESRNLVHYPCYSNYAICIGGMIIDETDTDIYKFYKNSNYGPQVDILAPHRSYTTIYYDNREITDVTLGTSNSAAIAAGVMATIMGERTDIKFNKNVMIKYLIGQAIEGVIKNVPSNTKNLLLNNGKHIVYSADSRYYGCGISSGLQYCSSNQCCGMDSKCHTSGSQECRIRYGCQASFGNCVMNISDYYCGYGSGYCPSGYCCSHSGVCGKTINECDFGCQKNYGKCNI